MDFFQSPLLVLGLGIGVIFCLLQVAIGFLFHKKRNRFDLFWIAAFGAFGVAFSLCRKEGQICWPITLVTVGTVMIFTAINKGDRPNRIQSAVLITGAVGVIRRSTFFFFGM